MCLTVRLTAFLPLATGVLVLLAAGFIPPDRSLSEVRDAGRLRVCHPTENPPWVTSDRVHPGLDIELLHDIAARLGLRLITVAIPQMDSGINPRGWNVTRARCDMIAGGLRLNDQTRAFLDVPKPYAHVGWTLATLTGAQLTNGGTVGVYVSGIAANRAELGAWLRQANLRPVVMENETALLSDLRDGSIDAALSDAPLNEAALSFHNLPEALSQQEVGFGFWKSDATLRDAVLKALMLTTESTQGVELFSFYGVSPIPNERHMLN